MIIYKMMLRIFSTFWKELILYFVIFLAFTFVAIGNPSTDEGNEFNSTKLDVAIINDSDDILSQHLVDYFDERHNIDDLTGTLIEDVENEVFSGTYSGFVHIPTNFKDLVLGGAEYQVDLLLNDRDMASNQITMEIENYLRLANARVGSGTLETNQLATQLDDVLYQTAEVEFAGENNGDNVLIYYTTGISLMAFFVLQIILSTVGMTMSEIKSKTIQDRINFSGISNSKYNTQIVLGQLTYGAILLPISLLVLWIYIPSSVEIDLVRMGISLALIIIVCLSMAFLLTSITTNRNIISGVTTVVSLGLAFISGLFIPYEIMGETIQRIAHFSPLFYFRQSVMKDISSYSELTTEWGLMLAFSVVFTLLGIAISQQKRMSKQ